MQALCHPLQTLYYLFFTRPNPFLAALDFYLLRPLADNTANKWKSADFALREKLGGGNFGAAFEGVRVEVGGGDGVVWRGSRWLRCPGVSSSY